MAHIWYEVYDFVEFVLKNVPEYRSETLKEFRNGLLEEENSAYRIVDAQVIEITDEVEIESVEKALSVGLEMVTVHLKRALDLLDDKKAPD